MGKWKGVVIRVLGYIYTETIRHRLVGFGDRHIHLKAKGKGPFATMRMCRMVI